MPGREDPVWTAAPYHERRRIPPGGRRGAEASRPAVEGPAREEGLPAQEPDEAARWRPTAAAPDGAPGGDARWGGPSPGDGAAGAAKRRRAEASPWSPPAMEESTLQRRLCCHHGSREVAGTERRPRLPPRQRGEGRRRRALRRGDEVVLNLLLDDDDGGRSDRSAATPRGTADQLICREGVEGAPPRQRSTSRRGALGDRHGGALETAGGA